MIRRQRRTLGRRVKNEFAIPSGKPSIPWIRSQPLHLLTVFDSAAYTVKVSGQSNQIVGHDIAIPS